MAFNGDGSTKCFIGSDWAAFEGKRAMSFAFTATATDSGNAGSTVIAKWNDGVTGAFVISFDTSGTNVAWSFLAKNGASQCWYYVNDGGLLDGDWHTYCITYNGANSAGQRWKAWKDGSALTLSVLYGIDADVTTANVATNLSVGGGYASSAIAAARGWGGKLAELRYWDSELSTTEAARWSQRARAGAWGWTNPVAYWPLGGLEGDNCYDYGPLAYYNLTATNSPTYTDHPPAMYPGTAITLSPPYLMDPSWLASTKAPIVPLPPPPRAIGY